MDLGDVGEILELTTIDLRLIGRVLGVLEKGMSGKKDEVTLVQILGCSDLKIEGLVFVAFR